MRAWNMSSQNFVSLAYGNFKTFKVISFKTDRGQTVCA